MVAEAAAVHHGHDSEINLDEILVHMLEVKASDLHLTENAPPMVRVQGDLQPVPGYGALDSTQLQQAIYAILTDRQKQRFEEDRELDLAYELPGAARFRVNSSRQQQGSVRGCPARSRGTSSRCRLCGLPEVLGDFADLPRGLVLVTGPTGSGKSTTLAAIIDQANRTRHGHILTVEDPIEFVHPHRNCVVNQREVGQDTLSFKDALKHALRQDPDIILVGEMRDLETISIALTAAETGHLVFGTLHTSSAGSTIDRIIDRLPADQQSQIRTPAGRQHSGRCLPDALQNGGRAGRVAATEVMIATPAVRNPHPRGQVDVHPVGAANRRQVRNAHPQPEPRWTRARRVHQLRDGTREGVRSCRAEPTLGKGRPRCQRLSTRSRPAVKRANWSSQDQGLGGVRRSPLGCASKA